MKKSLLTKCILCSLLTSMTVPAVAFADVGGLDAGSISTGVRQNRNDRTKDSESVIPQEQAWKPHADEPQLDVDLGSVDKQAADIRIKVTQIHFTGQDLFSEDVLQKLVAADIKSELSFNDLQNIAKKVTMFFHDQGYMTAIAYMPTQTVTDGIVTMEILEGHYGQISFDNTSELTTGRAEGLSHSVRTGRIIKRQPMDRLLLIINDIPGVKAHAFLSPGKENGTADTVFKLTTTETGGGVLYTDNYGNRFTGRERIGMLYHWNNLTHVGDQLQVGYLQSYNGGINNYDLRYELPVGNDGTFAGIEYTRTDYRLGEQFYNYDAYGNSRNWKLYTRTPLKRTLNNNLFFLFSYEHSNISDRIRIADYDSEKSANIFRFGFDGDNRNAWAASSYKIMHTIGHLTMDNTQTYEGDIYGTAGTFQKTTLDIYHIQKLNDRLTLHASLTAQYPWTPLDSSEKFYIGGYNAVRAYPQGETGGDEGILGSLELRYQTKDPHFMLAAFYDAGWVKYDKNPMDGADNSRTLAGAGLGVIWMNPGHSYARLDYAFPLTDRYSVNEGKNLNGRWWFQFVQKI